MRIAFVTTALVKYTAVLASALADDHDVAFVAMASTHETTPSEDFASMVERVFDPRVETLIADEAWRRSDPRSALTVWRAVRFLRRWKPDIIHVQRDFDYRVWLTVQGARQPYVVTVHDAWPHPGEEHNYVGKPDWWVRRPMRRGARRIIVHAPAIADELQRRERVPSEKIEIVPHAAFTNLRREGDASIAPRSHETLMLGRMYAYKGLDTLVAAAPLIAARVTDVNIVIHGRGPELGRLRPEIDRHPFFEVHETTLTDAELADRVRRAAVVVVPYREASQSAVVAFANGVGRPCIVTDVGGLPDMVVHGKTGIVIPPGDPEALAAAVSDALTDADLMQRLTAGVAELVAGELAPGAVARQTAAVYERALASAA